VLTIELTAGLTALLLRSLTVGATILVQYMFMGWKGHNLEGLNLKGKR